MPLLLPLPSALAALLPRAELPPALLALALEVLLPLALPEGDKGAGADCAALPLARPECEATPAAVADPSWL